MNLRRREGPIQGARWNQVPGTAHRVSEPVDRVHDRITVQRKSREGSLHERDGRRRRADRDPRAQHSCLELRARWRCASKWGCAGGCLRRRSAACCPLSRDNTPPIIKSRPRESGARVALHREPSIPWRNDAGRARARVPVRAPPARGAMPVPTIARDLHVISSAAQKGDERKSVVSVTYVLAGGGCPIAATVQSERHATRDLIRRTSPRARPVS